VRVSPLLLAIPLLAAGEVRCGIDGSPQHLNHETPFPPSNDSAQLRPPPQGAMNLENRSGGGRHLQRLLRRPARLFLGGLLPGTARRRVAAYFFVSSTTSRLTSSI